MWAATCGCSRSSGAAEIEELERDIAERPHLRAAQRRLAAELTTLVHGSRQTDQVVAASSSLFGRGDLRDLDAGTLDAALSEVPSAAVRLADRPTVVDLLIATGLAESRGAARRAVGEGGAYVNNVKVTDAEWVPDEFGPPRRRLAGSAPRQAQPRGGEGDPLTRVVAQTDPPSSPSRTGV